MIGSPDRIGHDPRPPQAGRPPGPARPDHGRRRHRLRPHLRHARRGRGRRAPRERFLARGPGGAAAAAAVAPSGEEGGRAARSGTGVVAEAVGDTALGTEVETRETGTQSEPAAAQYRTVATHTYAATFAITEHGVFSQLAVGGTLWDRSVFAAINVVNTDSIQFTYTLTSNSGG